MQPVEWRCIRAVMGYATRSGAGDVIRVIDQSYEMLFFFPICFPVFVIYVVFYCIVVLVLEERKIVENKIIIIIRVVLFIEKKS